MSDFLYGSICLTDIPAEHITVSTKNGKKYLNIAVSKRKEKGKFGETHTVAVSVPKDKRKTNDETKYIGNLTEWEGNNNKGGTFQPQSNDDLPF